MIRGITFSRVRQYTFQWKLPTLEDPIAEGLVNQDPTAEDPVTEELIPEEPILANLIAGMVQKCFIALEHWFPAAQPTGSQAAPRPTS